MTDRERITFCLELEVGTEPIAGEVRAPDGGGHPFVGWLELVNALERAGWHGVQEASASERSRTQAMSSASSESSRSTGSP